MNLRAYRVGLVLAFVSMANVVALRSFADAAILSRYSVRVLPFYLVLSSLCAVLLAAGYSALTQRRAAGAVDMGLDLGLAVAAWGALAVFQGNGQGRMGPAVFATAIGLVAFSAVASLAAWNAVASTVSGRRARLLLPRAGAAATAGAIMAGFGSSVLVARFGVEALPRVASVLALAMAVLSGSLQRAVGTPTSAPTAEPERAERSKEQARRLVLWLVVAAIAESAASSLLEFQFKATLKTSYRKDEIGAFIAALYGTTNLGTLCLQLFIVPRILSSRSVMAMFTVHPSAILLMFTGLLGWPGLRVLAFGRTVDSALKFSVSRSTQEVSLSALPGHEGGRWKVLLRGGAGQIGGIMAGVFLLAQQSAAMPSATLLSWVGLGLSIVWLWAARKSGSSYVSSLGAALGMSRVGTESRAHAARVARVARVDRRLLDKAVARLGDAEPRLAALGRAMLTRACPRSSELEPYLVHPDAKVREALFAIAALRPDPSARVALSAAVEVEEDEAALAMGFRALAAHDETSQEARARNLEGGKNAVSIAASAYLAELCAVPAEETWRTARALLARDGTWAASIFRRRTADGTLAESEVDAELSSRMERQDAGTRREVFRCVAALGRDALLEAWLAVLDRGDPVALAALSDLDASGLSRLASWLSGVSAEKSFHGAGARARARVARALCKSPTPECVTLLQRLSGDLDAEVRDSAMWALSRQAEQHKELIPRSVWSRALAAELPLLERYLAVRAPQGMRPESHERELSLRIARCLSRVLGLVAMMAAGTTGNRQTVRAAERRLRSPLSSERHGALDLLQEVVQGDDEQSRLLSLIERSLGAQTSLPTPAALDALTTVDPWLASVLSHREDTSTSHFEALRRTPLLAEVPAEALRQLARAAEEVEIDAGGIVVRQRERGESAYVVLLGRLDVLRDGRMTGSVGPGEVFGELALVDGAPRTATVRAQGPSRLLCLPRAAFVDALAASPEMGMALLRSLARWLRKSNPRNSNHDRASTSGEMVDQKEAGS
jgi:hypothetical protein